MDDTIYKELARKCGLDKHIVRIENEYACGTGFIYTVKNSIYVYIITAGHIVLKALAKGKNICIDYLLASKQYTALQFEMYTLFEESELTEALYEKLGGSEYEERHRDIVVLRIKEQEFQCNGEGISSVLCLSEEKISRDIIFAGYGFPGEKKDYEELFGNCLRWNSEDKMVTCKAVNIDSYMFQEKMKGFSGTGLVAEYEGSPVFIGIVAACDSEEMHQQFRIVGSTEISEELKKAGWETMEEYHAGTTPTGFYSGDMMALQDKNLEDMELATSELIKKELRQIDRKCLPQEMIIDERFYNIPLCDRNRKGCMDYWCGRVWPLFLASVLHDKVNDAYYLSKEGKKLAIEYICSEGDGKADLATVVGQAVSGSVLGEQIPGDCILVWQSRENPRTHRTFSRKKLKSIVANIASGINNKYKGFSRDAAYDLLDGEMKEKDFGIVHVQEIIIKLDGCQTRDEMREKMEEVLNGIWE